jgi:F-type H+-transporting ATPase subunit gamma
MKAYMTYKNQVVGFRDVAETTKTVEKIAASYVHFLKSEVSNLNLYSTEIERMLARLSMFYADDNCFLIRKKHRGGKALVVVTGNKGLVGGMWHMVISKFLEESSCYKSVIVVGEKGKRYLEEEGVKIIKSFSRFSNIPRRGEIEEINSYMLDELSKGIFSQVDILYPKFISIVEQKPLFVSFLPFKFNAFKDWNNDKQFSKDLGFPIFEPSKKSIFNRLLRKYIGIFLHKVILEAKLSELSARTVAMEHASAKTTDLIKKLIVDYAKQRRRVVTQKQLESFAVHKML